MVLPSLSQQLMLGLKTPFILSVLVQFVLLTPALHISMYRGRGGTLKVMNLKDDVGGGGKADNLPRHETQLLVVIQH